MSTGTPVTFVNPVRKVGLDYIKFLNRFRKNDEFNFPPDLIEVLQEGRPEGKKEEGPQHLYDLYFLSKTSLSLLETATHFAIDNRKGLYNILEQTEEKKSTLNDIYDRIKSLKIQLPYHTLTLSFKSLIMNDNLKEDRDEIPVLFILEEEKEDLISLISWQFTGSAIDTPGRFDWIAIQPIIISLSGDFCDRKDVHEIGEEYFGHSEELVDHKERIICIGEETFSEATAYTEVLMLLFPFLLALNSKHINAHTIRPPKKKKKLSNKKYPTEEYRILKIGGPSSSTYATVPRGTDEKKRRHLCRGHIRRYTADRPLFGKIKCTIFIPPHWRGDEKKGVILKDYIIEDKPETKPISSKKNIFSSGFSSFIKWLKKAKRVMTKRGSR